MGPAGCHSLASIHRRIPYSLRLEFDVRDGAVRRDGVDVSAGGGAADERNAAGGGDEGGREFEERRGWNCKERRGGEGSEAVDVERRSKRKDDEGERGRKPGGGGRR
eukprot:TRINITY_DN5760_c0_g2_i1.p4 TRINITY_DN5760_c0_g2~~TRINITY_DN5760_c0_g2_i1.p4  ORF type:complete len:107 (-),score=22.12 TRINITY_DN5760_c0_g2_i1:269-589(-)